MTIPVARRRGTEAGEPWAAADPDLEWTALGAEAKRERILCAAGRVFSREGLDAPMPAVAAAAGAGIASVYRQFSSKSDLLAALVTRRLEQTTAAAQEAAARGGDRWSALTEMLWTIVERQSGDDFLGEALAQVADDRDVAAAIDRALGALEEVMEAAREEGRLRADATTADLQLLFAATRAAKRVEPEAWQRMLVLLIDGLDARAGA
jgi:AcrR family transcriptional regulator